MNLQIGYGVAPFPRRDENGHHQAVSDFILAATILFKQFVKGQFFKGQVVDDRI